MGWSPVERSMMARRRWPSAACWSRKNPSESGPRCEMASVMRATRARDSSAAMTPKSMKPAMPHILGRVSARQFAYRGGRVAADQHASRLRPGDNGASAHDAVRAHVCQHYGSFADPAFRADGHGVEL